MEETIVTNQGLSASNGGHLKIWQALCKTIERANQLEVKRKGLFAPNQIGQFYLALDVDDVKIIQDKWGVICKENGLPDDVRELVGNRLDLLVRRLERPKRAMFCLVLGCQTKVDELLAQRPPAVATPFDSNSSGGNNDLRSICAALRAAISDYNLSLQVPDGGVTYGIVYPINELDVKGIKTKWKEQCKQLNLKPVIEQVVIDNLNQLVEKLDNLKYQRFHTVSGLNPKISALLTPLLTKDALKLFTSG